MRIPFARFGTTPERMPEGGACVSTFLLAYVGNQVLLGKVGQPEYWNRHWFLPLANPERWQNKWVLPASHLRFGEHPDVTARAVLREQLQFTAGDPQLLKVTSYLNPDFNDHWDLCFLYRYSLPALPGRPAWFQELRLFAPGELSRSQVGRGHDDILLDAGFRLAP